MFDGLKKKFSSFIESLSNKEAENEVLAEKEVQSKAEQEPGREAVHGLQQKSQRVTEVHKAVDAAPAHHAEPRISTTTKIKGLFLGHVKISEKDADPFIESLRIGLLQSDVNYDVADKVAGSIRRTLVGREVNSRSMEEDIRQGIRDSILSVLTKSSGIDMIRRINEKRLKDQLPYKMLFVGPNGAGKTTTMAKIANMLIANNVTCVLSASDTFRAAAIEQTAYHAGRLGISVIRGAYGADPASVAFDAIAHAKAHGIMAVLIDSAGRQETNRSLIEELKKISRVTDPDLKIFIGESISGNALLEQVKAIDEAVGIDGIILTKLDVDAKGGNTLSILSDTTIPVLYFGTGEKYSDIIPYDPQFIVDNILPSN
jgi:fused signal recognition particle receptor